MEITTILLILVTGLVAGFVNILSAGGSFLSLPMLIFLGLPPNVANGTNRVAVFSEGFFATAGFLKNKVHSFPFNIYLGISALLGAIPGTYLATSMDPELFKKVLASLLLVAVLSLMIKTNAGERPVERMDFKHKTISIVLFFFVGIYGGFIQAGVGFFIMSILYSVNRFPLFKANSVKAVVVVIYTLFSLTWFALEGQVNWLYGLILAVGNSTGAYIASHLAVKKGDKLIKKIVLAMIIFMGIKLWFY